MRISSYCTTKGRMEEGFFSSAAGFSKKCLVGVVPSMGEIPPPCATSRLPTCPTLRGCAPRAEAGGPPPLHAVPQAPRVGPLPEPGQHGPSGQAMSHIYRSRFRSPGPQPCGRCYPTPHYHALPPPRPATMDSSGLGSGHWGIRGPEGPSGDGAKAGPRPATSDPGSEGLAADLKKRRHPCLEQPLADQHHRTISVVPFLPSCRCRPSRRRALPTVIPPRPSAALDVTTTAAECPSTT